MSFCKVEVARPTLSVSRAARTGRAYPHDRRMSHGL
jgi:hypothetical protein